MHQLRDKKYIARRKNITRNFIIVGVLLFIAITGILTASSRIFSSIGQPFWKAQNIIIDTASDAGYLVRTKASVFDENEALKEENTNIKNQMIDYQILKSENEQLKELLGRIPSQYDFTLATILAKPNSSPYDTIIIDVGSNVDIIEGLKVYADGNIPIGEISKVYEKNSLVMLYSNPGQITNATIDGSNASVELVGRGGGNFEMTMPLDLPSENGRLILLPGTQSEVLAIINGLISIPTDPVKKVLLRSPVNIQSLKWVQVKETNESV